MVVFWVVVVGCRGVVALCVCCLTWLVGRIAMRLIRRDYEGVTM